MDPILCNIHKELMRQGKSQRELCRYLGMTEGNFSQWNAGKNFSYRKKLPLIAEFFEVTPEYLMTGNPAESEAERFFRKFQELSKNDQDIILYIMNKKK